MRLAVLTFFCALLSAAASEDICTAESCPIAKNEGQNSYFSPTAPLIERLHEVMATREPRPGGPLMVGGVAGSGTRSVIALMNSLGVHAAGDTRWDSHIGIAGYNLQCERSLDYTLSDFTEFERMSYMDSVRRDIERYLGPSPFTGHCYGAPDKPCDCGCFDSEAPIRRFAEAGQPWGFKQPEAIFVVPFLQKLYPSGTFVLVVRDGKDAALSTSSRDQLACRNEPTVEGTITRWGMNNRQLVEWALKHAYGDSFFVLRTEELVDAGSHPRLVPIINRILASVGITSNATAITKALDNLRSTCLGSDTNFISQTVNFDASKSYGKWRSKRHLFANLSDEARAALRDFGYLDH